jgi:ketosteroid isomerase-like protein
MRRTILLSALLSLCGTLIFAQSKDQRDVKRRLDEITTAMKKTDIAALNNVYASDFVFVNANGKKFTKTERLESIKTAPAIEQFAFSNEKIRVYGNAAVVNGEVRVQSKGQKPVHHYVMLVFAKTDGQWKEVSAQGTAVSE